jgi:sortase A
MFNRLDELEVGDGIVVETADGSFEYTVFKKHVVEPDDLSVLNKNDRDRVLTLITCTPLYTATHRLVIHAVIRDNQ